MKVNNQPDIQPAQRLDSVQEYYFSRKGKEVARMNAEGKDIISLAIGSPDMPPSQQTIDTLCREAQNPNGMRSTWTPKAKFSPSSVRRKASCT